MKQMAETTEPTESPVRCTLLMYDGESEKCVIDDGARPDRPVSRAQQINPSGPVPSKTGHPIRIRTSTEESRTEKTQREITYNLSLVTRRRSDKYFSILEKQDTNRQEMQLRTWT